VSWFLLWLQWCSISKENHGYKCAWLCSGESDRRPTLPKPHGNLEIETLKEGTIATAKASFERAKEQNANDRAPKTLRIAEKEEHLQTTSTMEKDPHQVVEANQHAELADKLSQETDEITE